jgi:hypothetical protein
MLRAPKVDDLAAAQLRPHIDQAGKATDGAAACPQPGGAGRVPTALHGDSNAVQS